MTSITVATPLDTIRLLDPYPNTNFERKVSRVIVKDLLRHEGLTDSKSECPSIHSCCCFSNLMYLLEQIIGVWPKLVFSYTPAHTNKMGLYPYRWKLEYK